MSIKLPIEIEAYKFEVMANLEMKLNLILIDAIKAEREACIAIVEKFSRKRKTYLSNDVIDALRARGETK